MNESFYLKEYYIEPSINKISSNQKQWKIEPKIMEVLVLLKQNKNQLVSRDDILNNVWGDTVVVDMVITRAISEIRSIFNDNSLSPTYIETIPKKGYRLIAPVIVSNSKKIDRKKLYYFLLGIVLLTVIVGVATAFFNKKNLEKNSISEYSISSLTSLKGWEYNPSISPDTKKVVFVWKDNTDTYHICTKSFDDESIDTLVSTGAMLFSPVWTPDKNLITYYKNHNGKVTINNVPSFGGNEQELLKTYAQLTGLSWSKGGQKLAYVDTDSVSKKSIIKIYSKDKNTNYKLTNPNKTFWGDHHPKFSPRNDKIAFIRTITEGDQDVYLVDLKTKKETKITSFNSNIFGFDWENESTLVLSTNFNGSTSVWKVNIKDDIKRKIPVGINSQNPTVKGNILICEQWTRDVDLWKTDLNNLKVSSTNPLITSTKFDFNASFSNDQKQIVFVSNRSGSYELWLSNSKGGNIKKITSIGKSLLGNTSWSPDDQLLAFNAQADGKSTIFIRNIKSKEIYSFTDTTSNDLAPSWSKKGNWLYYGSDKSGDWQIWKKPINNGGKTIQVTKNGGYYSQESFDGNYLYYSKFKKSGIWKLDLKTNLEERIIDSLSISDFANYSIYKDGIFYVHRNLNDLNKTEIKHYGFKSNLITSILKTDIPIPTNDNAISAASDGKSILYGQSNGYNGDLIFVENF